MESAKITNIDSRRNRANTWKTRWDAETKHFKNWEKKHYCKELAEYYEGKQFSPEEAEAYPDGMDPLVFNLFYSTVESRLPLMSFQNPVAQIKAKPGKMDWEPDAAVQEANLRTDMVNTFVTDPFNYFGDVCEQAILDAQFYFGIVEVGYSAFWAENPNAPKPVLKTDSDESLDPDTPEDNLEEEQPDELPAEERIFVKNIPPAEVRVGGNSKWITEQNSWIGYREFYRLEDLTSNPRYARILELHETSVGFRSDDHAPETDDSSTQNTDLVECLVIFDLRKKVRIFISVTHSVELDVKSFERLPLFPLRFSKPAVSHGWLPIPPAKSWKSPQDEYNEAHRAQAAYRQRALPKWTAAKGAFEDEAELDKLASGIPFTISKSDLPPGQQPLMEVPYSPLNAEFARSLVTSRDEFNMAAGTSLDVSPASDRETATKSKIVATRAGIRESRILGIVAKWMAAIVREVGILQATRLTKETWIKRTLDVEPTLGEIESINFIWAKIDPVADLNKYFDFEAEIDVSSLSPVTREEQKNSLMEFLATINQYPQFAFSPKLLRYLANFFNIRMEVVLKELQQLAMVAQLGMAAQAQQAAGGGDGQGNAMAQRIVAKATPSTGEQINNQLNNQVGIPQQ